jgi:ribosomal protein L14
MSLVRIKPLDRDKWHKKKGKESFTQPTVIEALIGKESQVYETGLTEEEQVIYGKKLGGVNLSTNFTGEAHPFYSQKLAWIPLENKMMVFDTEKPLDYVKVKLLKSESAPQVANSLKEYEEGKFPEATHVIFDEAEEIEVQAAAMELEQQAYVKVAAMTQADKELIVHVMTGKPVTANSTNFINAKIGELIKVDVKKFLNTLKTPKEEVVNRVLLLRLLEKNILNKDRGAIYYMGDMIAFDFEDGIKWLRDPENSQVKASLVAQINNK